MLCKIQYKISLQGCQAFACRLTGHGTLYQCTHHWTRPTQEELRQATGPCQWLRRDSL